MIFTDDSRVRSSGTDTDGMYKCDVNGEGKKNTNKKAGVLLLDVIVFCFFLSDLHLFDSFY